MFHGEPCADTEIGIRAIRVSITINIYGTVTLKLTCRWFTRKISPIYRASYAVMNWVLRWL